MFYRGSSYEGTRPVDGGHTHQGIKRRIALVIGNSAYPTAPLRNPRNDAEALATTLTTVSPAFDVTVALDVGRDGMENALEAFEVKLQHCDESLLFFAGHGLQVRGTNYLLPIDADINHDTQLRRRAFSVDEVLELMSRRMVGPKLIFLDACRDNPFVRALSLGGRRSITRGLAPTKGYANTLIAFATSPGNVALDGHTTNSPFTSALLAEIEQRQLSITDVMIHVRRRVLEITDGAQSPWDHSGLTTPFYFFDAGDTSNKEIHNTLISSAESLNNRESAIRRWVRFVERPLVATVLLVLIVIVLLILSKALSY